MLTTYATAAGRPTRFLVAISLLSTLAGGCSGSTPSSLTSPEPTTSTPAPPVSSPASTEAPTVSPAPASASPGSFARNPAPIDPGQTYVQAIDPAGFVAGVTHPFFPLAPGTTLVYGGAERVEITVLTETKVILGVTTTEVHDQVFVDGVLAEDTLDWYAQDRQGNVWYFGEQTAEYQDGKVTSTAGTWEAGVNGAQPGIIMLADPRVGDAYRQEFLAGEAEDLATVTGLSGFITVPAGSWSGADVMVTEEWTPLEPDRREEKIYVRGIGVVQSRAILGGSEVVQLETFK